MNIIFLGAHPDDLEFFCGGTIARCVAEGHAVWMANATNGSAGSPTLSKTEIGEVRRGEAEAVRKVLGAQGLIWMNEDDELLFDTEATRLKFVDAIRQAKADVIVTHNPDDYHPDHIACSKLATDARILSAVRLIETEHAPLAASPELFYMDSTAGINFQPGFHVDVSKFLDIKMKALACHNSQNAWLRAIFNREMMDMAHVQTAFRGLQAGVAAAEAFSQPQYWPRRASSLPF
jgi:LmbE family N-acetylglucosaminyl deacetylase